MSDDNDVRPLLMEIRDIVLRHEEVNRKDAEFRRRVLFVLLIALAAAVAAMGYGLMLVHATIKEIKQRQEQQQPQKIARLERGLNMATRDNSSRVLVEAGIQPRMKHGVNTEFTNVRICLMTGIATERRGSAHGWRGTPTDTNWMQRRFRKPLFLSVGLPRHPWAFFRV